MTSVDKRSLSACDLIRLRQRYPHYARAVHWMGVFWLTSRATLMRILWPTPTTRQNQNHGLRQLMLHGFIVPVDETQTMFRIGPQGVRLLADAGHVVRHRPNPRPSVRGSLLLASDMAYALNSTLLTGAQRSLIWYETPFSGQGARGGCDRHFGLL